MKVKDEGKVGLVYDATLALVAQYGIAGITMATIAKQAGIATGTLYIYFKNKEELINALFLETKQRTSRQALEGFRPEEPFKAGFRRIWLNLVKSRREQHRENLFQEQYYYSPYRTPESQQLTQQLMEPLFRLVERGKRELILKDVDTLLLIAYVYGSVRELVTLSQFTGMPLEGKTLEAAFQLCWDGVKS